MGLKSFSFQEGKVGWLFMKYIIQTGLLPLSPETSVLSLYAVGHRIFGAAFVISFKFADKYSLFGQCSPTDFELVTCMNRG